MNQFERITHLRKRFPGPPPPFVGIGSDCAVLPVPQSTLALKVDASVEGVHFTRELIALDDAADRAVEATLSDLAATGATIAFREESASGLLAALTLPRTVSDPDFVQLIEGIARAADRHGAVVFGGSLVSGDTLTITITALGQIPGNALTRRGARPGDRVFVTGPLGCAGLGLAALRSERATEPRFRPFVHAWRAPRARLAEGVRIARFASASVDLSDGLTLDLSHLAEQSNCGVVIDVEALPMRPGQRAAASQLGVDAATLALSAGEDYEIAFTAHAIPDGERRAEWHAIGEIVHGSGVWLRDRRGQVQRCTPAGWDHFCRRGEEAAVRA